MARTGDTQLSTTKRGSTILRDNAPDLREVPEEVRAQLEIMLVSHMDEMLPRVLLPEEQEVVATVMSTGSAHKTNTNLTLTLR